MNAKLRRRLDLLEKNTQLNRASMQEEIMAAALSAMSREDLEQLHQFGERGEPSVATLDEKAALPVSGRIRSGGAENHRPAAFLLSPTHARAKCLQCGIVSPQFA